MTSESLLLTLLYAITALAVIGAMNAHGKLRTGLSSVLAVFCLGAAVFHTFRYVAHKEAVMDMLTTPSSGPDASQPSPVAAMADTARPVVAKDNTPPPAAPQTMLTTPELISAVNAAQRLRSELAVLDPSHVSQMSDAEYLRMQNHVQGYKAEGQGLLDRASSPTLKQVEGGEELNAIAGSLAAATRDLEGFFKSENGAQEKAHSSNFHKNVQAAAAVLDKLKARLGGTITAAP